MRVFDKLIVARDMIESGQRPAAALVMEEIHDEIAIYKECSRRRGFRLVEIGWL